MPQSIRIRTDSVSDTARLNDSPTARKILAALPVTSRAKVWGDEVYFDIPVDEDEADDAQSDVPSGTLAFWPPGNCFCIFFGQRPASPVNVIGTLDGEPGAWSDVPAGAEIHVELTE